MRCLVPTGKPARRGWPSPHHRRLMPLLPRALESAGPRRCGYHDSGETDASGPRSLTLDADALSSARCWISEHRGSEADDATLVDLLIAGLRAK